jgi:hypothetical protein
MRLLLIEDDAVLRLGLARQLEAEGYRVDLAADGEDGLFQAREYPVDLAIVDLGLPKMNGLAVVEQLRADGRTIPRPDPHRSRQLARQGAGPGIGRGRLLGQALRIPGARRTREGLVAADRYRPHPMCSPWDRSPSIFRRRPRG